jgi:hypothetical protein
MFHFNGRIFLVRTVKQLSKFLNLGFILWFYCGSEFWIGELHGFKCEINPRPAERLVSFGIL